MTKQFREYQEVQVPEEVVNKFNQLVEKGDPNEPATFGAAGLFDWFNQLAREGGWRVVWQGFNFPYVVLERDVEEVEK